MNKRVVIIDYQMGNVGSVEKAFKRLGVDAVISGKKKEIEGATHLVLPGVGAFGDGIKNLKKSRLTGILEKRVLKDGVPFLGICLGMQLLATAGYEFGTYQGLGWITGEVVKLKANRLPHIGWNNIKIVGHSPLFKDLPDNNFYFVHSYRLKTEDKKIISSFCSYGERFPASIQKENIFATQFHPEKSQLSGLKILENFLNYAKN